MRFVSWNVNGFRAVMKKGFLDFFKHEFPDIMCLQETKLQKDQVDVDLGPSYHEYWNCAEKKGYSGTAIFTRIKPLNVVYDMGIEEHDREGRVITLEFDEFFLVNVYTPNSKRGLVRLEYRQKWDRDFLNHVKKLEKKKPVIFCGDLNVAHKEIDLANPKNNVMNAGFTKEEREGFDNIVSEGFVDTFRHFHPDEVKYSWWSYMFNARAKNIGWRIDYFCVSKRLMGRVKEADILTDVMGSDHCPVVLELD